MSQSSNTNSTHAHDRLMGALDQAQFRFGYARLEMGILLEQVRRSEAWRGRADSFGRFLEEQRINDSAAYQYMRVASKFFYELALPDSVLYQLAQVNMATLDAAARIATPENIDDILAMVTTLSQRDARLSLDELGQEQSAQAVKPRKRDPTIQRMMRMYKELADEQRLDLRNALRLT